MAIVALQSVTLKNSAELYIEKNNNKIYRLGNYPIPISNSISSRALWHKYIFNAKVVIF